MSTRDRGVVSLTAIFVGGAVLLVATNAWASGGTEGADGMAVPVNDMIEAVVNFVIFLWLLVKFGKAPISDWLNKRADEIERQLDEAARLRQEAEGKLAEYDERLERFDAEQAKVLENYRREARKDRDAIIRGAKEAAERMREDAETILDYEVKHARQQIRGRIVNDAVGRARDHLQDTLNKTAKNRVVDEFVDALADGHGSARA